MSEHYDGLMQLGFSERNGRVITRKKYYEGNSRISADTSQQQAEMPYYFLISTGGGFLEGENYHVDIDLTKGAKALVTTQAPTYVFKCDKHGHLTKQKTLAHLEEDTYLEYLADEVIPYGKSRYLQHNIFELDQSSELIYSDGVTAGWSEDDKPFQYTYFHSLTQIYRDGQLVFHDNMLLEPEFEDMFALGYFEGKTNYNNLVIISQAIDADFIKDLRAFLDEFDFVSDFGISELACPGLAVKILGPTAGDNREVIMECTNYFREKVKGLPALRLRKNDRRG
ncbi:urease accessory protein UreD [Streptococcus saliviloxodontae]|uniref:Urease accessory protein UreD n=1 Tax=Streptococcus saliviloxodontae TaxID=1349416 RepID=A0ABS2PIR9_9STRE|nr:urease accessory protein UreD [Streptococcus saliviloxodontae]MBM7635329.1 urease accessory protein [Streptococcus saliviloxodontae]